MNHFCGPECARYGNCASMQPGVPCDRYESAAQLSFEENGDARLIRELAHEAARAAHDAGYREASYGFGAFIREQFAVYASTHPRLIPYRVAFLQAAGVIR